ncbi:hypothetical protein L6274_04520 [Candidatus Parcubacteria bacterium]|nr:hypothetical protein [Candidatus Parcubacteria bacterium]
MFFISFEPKKDTQKRGLFYEINLFFCLSFGLYKPKNACYNAYRSMDYISKLEQKGVVEALDIKPEDLFEVRFNLLGFFSVLYKIDQRLRKEKNLKKSNNLNKDSLK